MSMRTFRVFVLLVAAVLCLAGNANCQEPTKFTLKGDIGYILKMYGSGAVIESVALRQYPNMKLISNGGSEISHYGVFDGQPQVAELVVDLTVPGGSGTTSLVFVLEEGTLVFDGGIVPQGGKLNNALRTLTGDLQKMKEKDAMGAIKEFVSKEENAPASVILLTVAKQYVGAENTFNLVMEAPEKVRTHWVIKSMMQRLGADAMMESNQKSTAKGMMFKDFSVFCDGKMQNLSDYVGKGKYVLVDFWASWCGPCMQEIPNLVALHEKYAGENFEIVGVALNDKTENTKKAIQEKGMKYPQIIGVGSEVSAIYGINAIPHLILFAPDGTIVQRGMRGPQIEEAVKKALKLK